MPTLALQTVLCILPAIFHPDMPGDAGSVPDASPTVMVRELQAGGWSEWITVTPRPGPDRPGRRELSGPNAISCTESTATIHSYTHRFYHLKNLDAPRDRFLTVAICFPFPGNQESVTWYDDITTSRPVDASGLFSNTVPAATVPSPHGGLNSERFGGEGTGGYGDAVGTGRMSPYPFACVTAEMQGLAIAIDIGSPVVHRFSYSRDRGLVAEFDLALTAESIRDPNGATLRVLAYPVDPQWGFRSAAEIYQKIFPRYYERRLSNEGIWMPFTPVNEVEGWQDFGFAIHETSLESGTMFRGSRRPVAEVDRALGITSFQYTEPWDIQVPVDPGGLGYKDVERVADAHAQEGPQIRRSIALDSRGQWTARLISAPWFTPPWAISYTTSVAPDASSSSRYQHIKAAEIDSAMTLGFDGIYFDSLEFFWHYDLDYRPEHRRASPYPLVYSVSSPAPSPAVWNYTTQFALLQDVCPKLHAAGKLTMGNGFSWIPFSVAHLDILGTEFSWFMKDEEKSAIGAFRRTVCGQKPVVLLLNEGLYSDDFTKSPHEGYRQYFEESLFYGFYPSFFSADASNDPYWKKPESYNTGRPFFKKYVPLIKEINRQGWQPVTHARTSDPRVRIERFDAPGDTLVFFTIRNVSHAELRDVDIEIEDSGTDGKAIDRLEEMVHSQRMDQRSPRGVALDVAPRTTYLLKCVLRR